MEAKAEIVQDANNISLIFETSKLTTTYLNRKGEATNGTTFNSFADTVTAQKAIALWNTCAR